MDKLIKELGESFDLNGKELLILEALMRNSLSANKISEETKIPLGRIYEYLNNLINLKLIEKSEKKPYKYSIENLDQNIIEFLRHKFDDMVEKQNKVMSLIEHKSQDFDEIDIVASGDDFSFRTVQLVGEARYIKNVVRHGSVPFALYPENSKDFLKVRNSVVEKRSTLAHTTPEMTFMIYRAHNEAYKKGKAMEYIVEESALKFHFDLIKKKFGKQFFDKMIKEIKRRLSTYNVHVHVIKEFIPMQTFITEKKLFLSLIHFEHTHGIIIRNDAAVKLYGEYFDEMKKRCTDVFSYL